MRFAGIHGWLVVTLSVSGILPAATMSEGGAAAAQATTGRIVVHFGPNQWPRAAAVGDGAAVAWLAGDANVLMCLDLDARRPGSTSTKLEDSFRPTSLRPALPRTFLLEDGAMGVVRKYDCDGRLLREWRVRPAAQRPLARNVLGEFPDGRLVFGPMVARVVSGDTVAIHRTIVAVENDMVDTLVTPRVAERRLLRGSVQIPVPLEAPFTASILGSRAIALIDGELLPMSPQPPSCTAPAAHSQDIPATTAMMRGWAAASLASGHPGSQNFVEGLLATLREPRGMVSGVLDVSLSPSGCWLRVAVDSDASQRWTFIPSSGRGAPRSLTVPVTVRVVGFTDSLAVLLVYSAPNAYLSVVPVERSDDQPDASGPPP